MNSSTDRKRVCVIAFSHTAADARVLRQARGLAQEFHVTVCGFGANPFPPEAESHIAWREMPHARWEYFGLYPLRQLLLLPGLILPGALHWCEAVHSWTRAAAKVIRSGNFDVVVCNDTETITLGVLAQRLNPKTKIVLDLHEYATRESDLSSVPFRKKFKSVCLILPLRRRLLKHFAPKFDAVMTVNDVFSDLYPQEFGMKKPVVIMNAPDLPPNLPAASAAGETVNLIHHGGLGRYREPERMIRAVGLCPPQYRLHFMFGNQDPALVEELQAEAAKSAPGRVEFHPPVKPAEVPAAIARFDAGLYILPPKSFNDEHCLPNKFFDFIVAGLAVVISPNPCMASIVRRHGLGTVAADYSPEAMAEAIQTLTTESITAFRTASREARTQLNGAVEMEKVRSVVRGVLAQ
jgi:glycosyltransferase involved in cell wall biosynthesis